MQIWCSFLWQIFSMQGTCLLQGCSHQVLVESGQFSFSDWKWIFCITISSQLILKGWSCDAADLLFLLFLFLVDLNVALKNWSLSLGNEPNVSSSTAQSTPQPCSFRPVATCSYCLVQGVQDSRLVGEILYLLVPPCTGTSQYVPGRTNLPDLVPGQVYRIPDEWGWLSLSLWNIHWQDIQTTWSSS